MAALSVRSLPEITDIDNIAEMHSNLSVYLPDEVIFPVLGRDGRTYQASQGLLKKLHGRKIISRSEASLLGVLAEAGHNPAGVLYQAVQSSYRDLLDIYEKEG